MAIDQAPRPTAHLVSDYWGVDRPGSERRPNWLQHKVAREYINMRVSGDPNIDTFAWFKQKFFPKPAELCLSLGCGSGRVERMSINLGISNRFDGIDISEGAIDKARQAAIAAGLADRITYNVANLDDPALSFRTEMYDGIFAHSSIHHVFQLENLFRQCRSALKAGGLLFLDEYIGPSRFQTSPQVTDLINRIRTALPVRYRKNLFTNDGTMISSYVPPRVEEFECTDPSESIRSGEIVTTLKMYFDIIEYRPYGGAIQHMLFSGIMGNFDEHDERDVAFLKVISILEEALEGTIGSDFAAVVAQPLRG
jgi:SAM-dependent methyltransferase